MKNTKKAVVLIYVLFLVMISVIFATILLNNNSYLFNINDYYEYESKLFSNIDNDSKISIDLNKQMNSNWDWFIDNISCPSTNVSMSWGINNDDIWTILIYSWVVYCEWNYFWNSLKIYFNTWFTDFDKAEYLWNIITLSWWLWLSSFWDSDNTFIDFSSYDYFIPDWFDDNFNSDNYLVTSTWNIYYPNFWQDDDVLARKTFYWFVSPYDWFKKVFWNTDKTIEIIDQNINNNDTLNIKIWDVVSWYLHFDVDNDFAIKLIKFDKTIYNNTKELSAVEIYSWELLSSTWYLQNNSWILSLSWWITWNEYNFDFSNNYYAIFLKSVWEVSLVYNITWKTNTGSWIYINPIDDSAEDIIKYIWNEIIIDNNWRYISKEIELFFEK